jgi:hypothetical protein
LHVATKRCGEQLDRGDTVPDFIIVYRFPRTAQRVRVARASILLPAEYMVKPVRQIRGRSRRLVNFYTQLTQVVVANPEETSEESCRRRGAEQITANQMNRGFVHCAGRFTFHAVVVFGVDYRLRRTRRCESGDANAEQSKRRGLLSRRRVPQLLTFPPPATFPPFVSPTLALPAVQVPTAATAMMWAAAH